MVNTLINETKNDIEELQITHKDITERTRLRNKLHNFKGLQENREEKHELFELRKGDRNTRNE